VPGIGTLLSLVLLYESPDIDRCARVQDCVAYCRLGTCARESAGTRYGPSGKKSGNAHLQWAFSDAAVLVLRHNPAGQQPLARLDHKHGKGKALTILAHQLARAVYSMLKRAPVFAMDKVLHGEREPSGCAWGLTGHTRDAPASRTLQALCGCVSQRPGVPRPCIPEPWPGIGCPLWLLALRR
jgi:Transposase IS116/IS110/IS902 family